VSFFSCIQRAVGGLGGGEKEFFPISLGREGGDRGVVIGGESRGGGAPSPAQKAGRGPGGGGGGLVLLHTDI